MTTMVPGAGWEFDHANGGTLRAVLNGNTVSSVGPSGLSDFDPAALVGKDASQMMVGTMSLADAAAAQALSQETLSLSWVPSNANLWLDFANDRYFSTPGLSSILRTFLGFTRATPSLDTDPTVGTSTIIASGKPSRGKSGIFIGAARTNAVVDTEMTGSGGLVIAGLPDNWDYYDSTWQRGFGKQPSLVVTVLDKTPVNGQARLKVRIQGVPEITGGVAFYPQLDNMPSIAAAQGQTWTAIQPVRLAGGLLTNVQMNYGIVENTNNYGYLADSKTAFTPDSSPLGTKRYGHTRTLTNASTAFVQGFIVASMTAGQPVDLTLEFGRQTQSQSRYAFPIDIRSPGVSTTRNADVVVSNAISGWIGSGLPFTVVVKGRAPLGVGTGNNYLFQISDATSNNAVAVLRGTGRSLNAFVVASSSSTVDLGATVADGADFSLAVSFEANNVQYSLNGAAVLTDATATMPSGLTRLALGSELGTAQHWDSFIRVFGVIPGATTGAALQALSAA